jgi:hypothetical protein
MAGVLGNPRNGFFYPKLVWGGGSLDFDDPAIVQVPNLKAIQGTNIAVSGVQETLHERVEAVVNLTLRPISVATLTTLRDFFVNWGLPRKESLLILDRLDTCAGQLEYDLYNRFFTRAILLNDTFAPQRMTPSRSFYQIDLAFRQNGS